MNATENLRTLYPRLIDGDPAVIGIFSAKATVDTPLAGKQLPPEFIAETRAWLEAHSGRVVPVSDTVTPGRAVHELLLTLEIDGTERDIPVLLVADLIDERIRDLRVYHSTRPITGRHELRRPLMDYHLAHQLPAAVLAERPASAMVGTVTDDGETTVFEYMVDSGVGDVLAPQAGAAVCPLGGTPRFYDDVEATAAGR